MNETEKDQLIKDLCQCIRVYRVTCGDACRLIGKRKDWRNKNNLPQDSLLDEVWDLSHDAIVSERFIWNKYAPNDTDGSLKRIWCGVMQQYER